MPDPEADYEIDWAADELPKLQPPAPSPDRELALIQARAAAADGADITEGVVTDYGTVELNGRTFRVAEKVGLMPLLKFASASDLSTEDPRALSAIYSMLKDSIYEGSPGCGKCERCLGDEENGSPGDETMCKAYDKGDWADFEQHAIDSKADADELLTVVTRVLEVISGRPTAPPAGSSPGRRVTQRASTGNSSARRGRASRR